VSFEPACVAAPVVHLRIDRNQVLGGINEDLPNQQLFDERQVALPVHAGLTEQEVSAIWLAVKTGW